MVTVEQWAERGGPACAQVAPCGLPGTWLSAAAQGLLSPTTEGHMPRALFGCRLDFRTLSGLCQVCCSFSTGPLCYEFSCWFCGSGGAPAPLHVSLDMPALTVSRRLTLPGAGGAPTRSRCRARPVRGDVGGCAVGGG